MRVFGIDCGTNCTGYGVVDVQSGKYETRLVAVAAGGPAAIAESGQGRRASLPYF